MMHREIYHESMDLKLTKGNVNGEKREMTNGQADKTDPDTSPGFPGWSRLVEFHCTIPRECTKGPHLKEK